MRPVRSDTFRARTCGNGSMRTARNMESGDRISIKIRRMWRRSTVKNTPVTIAQQNRSTRNRTGKSATGWRMTITAWGNAQKPQDRRGLVPSNSDQQLTSSRAGRSRWLRIAGGIGIVFGQSHDEPDFDSNRDDFQAALGLYNQPQDRDGIGLAVQSPRARHYSKRARAS